MYVFNVLDEIALFDSFFPAHGTLKSESTLTRDNIIVKGECLTWKSKSHSKSTILGSLQFSVKLFLATMHFSHVHIEKVSGGAYFTAVFAIIHKSSRKMHTLNMFVKIILLKALLPALSTLKTHSIFTWNNVIIKWDWPTWKNDALLNQSSVHFRNMNVQMIPSRAGLTAVLASVHKGPRKMYILNMFAKIALVVAFFPADWAMKRFGATLTSNDVVIKWEWLAWKRTQHYSLTPFKVTKSFISMFSNRFDNCIWSQRKSEWPHNGP